MTTIATQAWYLTSEALALLADCAKDEPLTQIFTRRYAMTSDEWREYDREDARVDALIVLRNGILEPLLDDATACTDGTVDRAGLMVGVDRAIDAVVSEPMCAHYTEEHADVARVAAEIALAMESRVAA